MPAVFRFDASPAIGAGHAYRCLTLARTLEALGWRCGFAVNAEAPAAVPALAKEELLILNETDQPGTLRRHWPEGADWLVVDHYGLDGAWEARCRGWAGAILVIDDLADRSHDCDALVDQTFGRQATDYAGRVPAGCRLLTGSDYALLRPAFAAARAGSLLRRSAGAGLERVLVGLGATDPDNHTLAALDGIAESGLPLAVDVVLGAGAPHLEAVRARIAAMAGAVELHVDTSDMPALMARADLAIGAAGTSTWERCCLGLPSLLVVIAANQRLVAEAVAGAGAARLLAGPYEALSGQIAHGLRALTDDPIALRELSTRAAGICDGRGTDRLGLALTPAGRARDGRPISLRLARPADEARILDWQRHPTTRRFARNPAVPSVDEHRRWFEARCADPDCLLAVITLDGAPAGVLRLDAVDPVRAAVDAPAFEVSILVAPDCRGLGVALEALRFLRRWQGAAVIVAEVLPGNSASQALFREAGYLPGAGGLLYSHPAQPVAMASN